MTDVPLKLPLKNKIIYSLIVYIVFLVFAQLVIVNDVWKTIFLYGIGISFGVHLLVGLISWKIKYFYKIFPLENSKRSVVSSIVFIIIFILFSGIYTQQLYMSENQDSYYKGNGKGVLMVAPLDEFSDLKVSMEESFVKEYSKLYKPKISIFDSGLPFDMKLSQVGKDIFTNYSQSPLSWAESRGYNVVFYLEDEKKNAYGVFDYPKTLMFEKEEFNLYTTLAHPEFFVDVTDEKISLLGSIFYLDEKYNEVVDILKNTQIEEQKNYLANSYLLEDELDSSSYFEGYESGDAMQTNAFVSYFLQINELEKAGEYLDEFSEDNEDDLFVLQSKSIWHILSGFQEMKDQLLKAEDEIEISFDIFSLFVEENEHLESAKEILLDIEKMNNDVLSDKTKKILLTNTYHNLGVLYMLQGEVKKSEKYFDKEVQEIEVFQRENRSKNIPLREKDKLSFIVNMKNTLREKTSQKIWSKIFNVEFEDQIDGENQSSSEDDSSSSEDSSSSDMSEDIDENSGSNEEDSQSEKDRLQEEINALREKYEGVEVMTGE